MLAILYLILACMTGYVFLHALFLNSFFKSSSGQNPIWVAAPAAMGFGILLLTWPLYILAFFFHVKLHITQPLVPANAIVMTTAAVVCAVCFFLHRKKKTDGYLPPVNDRKLFLREAVLYGIILLFVTLTMFYVFFTTKDNRICAGYTVFSDYAPHVSMIRSFSKQANYPTQYPFFGGSDVKYHFMFQFLTGNLEFLGLRLDLAYNIPSILALLGFLMLATQISFRLFSSFAAELPVPFLFFFRSGTAFGRFIIEHLRTHDLGEALRNNETFLGYTENENWGLWNYNVYLNQRHLAFGLLIAAAVIWYFMYSVDAACEDTKKQRFGWFAARWTTKDAWMISAPVKALILGILLGSATFWNGAAVIAALLILCGMAVFSDHKADYIILAVSAVAASLLQTHAFIQESAFKAQFYWGFLLDEPTILDVLVYLIQIMGITIPGAILLLFLLRRRQSRILVFSFLLPVVFAFTMSLTPDVTVNQKYIMISAAFLSVIWGGVLARLCERKIPGRICAGLLLILLIANGFYDFCIILKDNGLDHSYQVDLNSDVTAWLSGHLTSEDLLLEPNGYTFHEVPMSGVMMYQGWAYYAWSAGYDTGYRSSVSDSIYASDDPDVIKMLCKKEGIDYILYDESGMTLNDGETMIREDAIAQACQLVYTSEDGTIRIYKAR